MLAGPQGTLFGRNSSAVVVNITTSEPSFTRAATVEASFGDFTYNQEKLVLTGPVIDAPGVATILEREAIKPIQKQAALRGIADKMVVYEIP